MILNFNSFIISEDVIQNKDAKSDISKFQQFTKNQAEQQSVKSSKPTHKPVIDDSKVHKSIENAIKDVETQKAGINQGFKTLDEYTKAKLASTPNPTDPNAKKQQDQQNKESETIKKDLKDRVKKFDQTVSTLQKEKDKLIKK